MSTIMTDDELKAVRQEEIERPNWKFNELRYARAIEAAVFAKLAQQEPVAEFAHWLNARRDSPVAEVFHELVARFSSFAIPQQADRQRVPDEWRELLMEVVCLTDRPDLQVRASAMLAAAPEAPAQAESDLMTVAYMDGFTKGKQEAQASAVDERAAFEAWWKGDLLDWRGHQNTAALHAWEAWQARAALAQKGGAA